MIGKEYDEGDFFAGRDFGGDLGGVGGESAIPEASRLGRLRVPSSDTADLGGMGDDYFASLFSARRDERLTLMIAIPHVIA